MDATDSKALQREILLGLWKVHILHHAAEGPVVGRWMLQELRRHGYEVSPGTLYPLLHRMERLGWLRCEGAQGAGPKARRPLRATARGREVLAAALRQVAELRAEAGGGVGSEPEHGERGAAAPGPSSGSGGPAPPADASVPPCPAAPAAPARPGNRAPGAAATRTAPGSRGRKEPS